MSKAASEQKFEQLNQQFCEYCNLLRTEWLKDNRSSSHNVYEVMNDKEKLEVDNIITRWKLYITPLAESWWKERGFGITWPEDDSKPVQIYEFSLDATS